MTIHESLSANGVLELVMDNPKVNALPIADTDRLAEILNGVEQRSEVAAVILTATGRGFSAGVDIKEMQKMPGNSGIIEVNRACLSAFRAVYGCAVPVICAVNDFCFGTGIGLAGSADIVVRGAGCALRTSRDRQRRAWGSYLLGSFGSRKTPSLDAVQLRARVR